MKKLITLTIFVFIILFSYTIIAQQMRAFRDSYNFNFPKKIMKISEDPLPAGTYTIGTGGDFPTIDSAFNKLSVAGISGYVYLYLIDTLYIAPTNEYGFLLNGPIPGAGGDNFVQISSYDKNVTIKGNGRAVITFINTSHLLFGEPTHRSRKLIKMESGMPASVDLTDKSITILAMHNTQFKYNDCIDFFDNSKYNTVNNIEIINEDYARGGVGICFWPTHVSNLSSIDSNIVSNNFIKKAGWGIYFEGPTTRRATGNVITHNSIGSKTDSLIGWGIQLNNCKNTLVENNVVQNLKFTTDFYGDIINVGINSYCGSGDIICNNIVHNIKSNAGYTSTGILLSGSPGKSGSNNLVYNNMVYDIQSTSTSSDSRVAGIQMWNQNNPKVYYNSVSLTGKGSNQLGSAAMYIYDDCSNVEAKNNILVNTRDETPYCASAIYKYTTSTLNSDNNDLYYEPNQYNCMVRISNNDNTLEEWEAKDEDLNSVSEIPHFMEGDLHINKSVPTNLESHGIPITGIDVDIDGDVRGNVSPDIGADEFDGTIIVGINEKVTQPFVFNLNQNYPNPFNPSTTIKYSIPEEVKSETLPTDRQESKVKNVMLKVYDILGREVAILVNQKQKPGNYEVSWNASQFPSGIYFYRINATPSGGQAGDYVCTKKMILLR